MQAGMSAGTMQLVQRPAWPHLPNAAQGLTFYMSSKQMSASAARRPLAPLTQTEQHLLLNPHLSVFLPDLHQHSITHTFTVFPPTTALGGRAMPFTDGGWRQRGEGTYSHTGNTWPSKELNLSLPATPPPHNPTHIIMSAKLLSLDQGTASES